MRKVFKKRKEKEGEFKKRGKDGVKFKGRKTKGWEKRNKDDNEKELGKGHTFGAEGEKRKEKGEEWGRV